MSKVLVSLHGLDAEDLGTAMMHESGHLSICVGGADLQLHWDSFEAFEAWIDRLHSILAYQALLVREDLAS